ncbi:MAG: M20/M25/M40 family metallo-hydrolase [Candidatus Gastranaerophilales bacterium]|nr:M20/M25/M40 family metallo-hydrolase [Candidatus Gastranaerophilales bacterium]
MDILEIFEELASIPSPSLGEINVSNKILEYTYNNGINAFYDNYQNLIINLPANDPNKKPILLSAHMDVVGNSAPVNIRYSEDRKYIQTDGTRTLGADDKAGIAVALKLAIYLAKNPEIKHGGLEIVLTRDEETNMSGINHVEFDKIESENVLVLDSDSLGNFEIAGAGYTKLDIEVTTKLGGHSGNDIQDKKRYNAAKLIADLVSKLPNGAYKVEKGFTITSCNLGSIVAGATDIGLERILEQENPNKPYSKTLVDLCADNIINTKAYAHYSLRSSNQKYEFDLIDKFQKQIDKFNKKYGEYANAKLSIKVHMPMFEKSPNQEMAQIAKQVGKKIDLPIKVQSFHAGAETHIYANKTNKYGKKFKPVLVGVANIDSMHSPNEKMEIDSLYTGYEFIKKLFLEYNS